MGWIYLLTAVAGSTVIWPIGRWALRGDGHPGVMGFWTSLTMGAVSLIGCACAGETAAPREVWIAGLLMAAAYAIGFNLLIMRCLKIGPAGPTVTVNNMAMVFGVLYGVLYLRPRGIPHPLIIAGAVGTCLALVLIGMGGRLRGTQGRSIPPGWLPMLIAGGAFSGLSFITQTYIGEAQRSHRFGFLAIASFASALLLLPLLLRRPALWRQRREVIAGLMIGVFSAAGMALTLAAFRYFGSAIVLPFSVTTPVILVLFIGHFVYRERLDRLQLAGSITGIVSVLLLALGSG